MTSDERLEKAAKGLATKLSGFLHCEDDAFTISTAWKMILPLLTAARDEGEASVEALCVWCSDRNMATKLDAGNRWVHKHPDGAYVPCHNPSVHELRRLLESIEKLHVGGTDDLQLAVEELGRQIVSVRSEGYAEGYREGQREMRERAAIEAAGWCDGHPMDQPCPILESVRALPIQEPTDAE